MSAPDRDGSRADEQGPSDGPEEQRDGDTYTFLWRSSRYGLRLTNLSDERDGLEGEVTAFAAPRGAGKRTLVHTGRLRLLGTNSKRDLARHLDEQTKSVGFDGNPFDWRLYVEVACHRTIEQYRQGEPVIELADVEPKPQAYVIEGVIPERRTSLLIGDGASTKSIQALAMGLAVVTGRAVGPYTPLVQGHVLYVDAETDEDEQAERLDRLARGVGLPGIPRGFYYQRQLRSLVQSRQGLRDAVSRTRALLTVVDSAGAVAAGSLNEDQVAIAITNALRTIGDTTRLIVSHVSKATAAQDRGRGRAYGNVYFENYARSVLELKREGTDPADFAVGVYHRKVNRGPLRAPFAVRVRFDDPMGPITLREGRITESPILANYGSDADQIVAAVEAAGGVIEFPQLVEATGLKESTLRYRLRLLPQIVKLPDPTGRDGGGRNHPSRYALRSDRREFA